jgi:hypothetical protein
MHGRFAKYSYSGDAHELAARVEDGLLPIFKSQPGFKAYSVMATDDTILSFSAWESASDAEAANEAAASWVAENLGGDDIELKTTKIGEILIGTAIGVSTKAGATA